MVKIVILSFLPMKKKIFYLSEANGNFNVFAMDVSNPKSNTALTDFKTYPVRFLSIAGNGLMSFSYDGELYTLKKGETAKKLAVTIQTQAISNSDNYISINGGVREMAISPDGKRNRILLLERGILFTSVEWGINETNNQYTWARKICRIWSRWKISHLLQWKKRKMANFWE